MQTARTKNRLRSVMAVALFLGLFGNTATSQPLSININQPTIETGQTLTFSVTGPVGMNIWMLLDFVPGTSFFPR
jgi:hypothetical protein